MHVLSVLDRLIILSKFITEKEKKEQKKKKKKEKKNPLHLHSSKITVFVVLLSFCVILTRVRMTRESECVINRSSFN